MSASHLWAGWRASYVHQGGAASDACVFCGLLTADLPEQETNIVMRTERVAVILNAFPYGTGHVLVLPVRHVDDLTRLDEVEKSEVWRLINDSCEAIRSAYAPDGMNIGFNLGESAGAGVPGHLHGHVLPRWSADTNFLTSVANARVLPEPLDETWRKLREAWPR